MVFQVCIERARDTWVEQRERIRQRREERRRICRNLPWPLTVLCRVIVSIIFFIIEVISLILVVVTFLECIICSANYIVIGHRMRDSDELGGIDPGDTVPSRTASNQNDIAFTNTLIDNRFDVNDSGTRCEFRINSGVPEFIIPGQTWQVIGNGDNPRAQVISFSNQRSGERSSAPVFDMIAANGSRILVKEKDRPCFYFTTLEHEFRHALTRDVSVAAEEISVPGYYIKLDPQYNQPGFNVDDPDLEYMDATEYGRHPSVTLYESLKFLRWLPNKDNMLVQVQPKVWHLLDSRPPFGSGQPPQWIEMYDHVTYVDRIHGFCESRVQRSIKIYSVQDLGVGNMYWHIHYDDSQGGEVFNGPFDIMHGPVADFGGYCDGTCTFYILCKVKVDETKGNNPTKESYAILWIDEQTYGTERWRLLHPLDNDWSIMRNWSLTGGFLTGIHGLKNIFHGFSPNKYWCPFEDTWFGVAERIKESCRLAVSRQIILVTGYDPEEGQVIYSINYSWGSMDKSWRWRRYPENCKIVEKAHFKDALINESYCFFDTIRIREDMTICMEGKKSVADGHVDGYWYQKYLPADHQPVPPANELQDDSMRPREPYTQEWHFITSYNFRNADIFSHFGVYDVVDSRSQYYYLDFEENVAQDSEQYFSNSIPWVDLENKLGIFGFTMARPFGREWIWQSPPSLFNDRTCFKILKREPFGYIATYWDKRDDDLRGLTIFPNTKVTLTSYARVMQHLEHHQEERTIEVTLSGQKRDWTPPVVQRAKVEINHSNGSVVISFYTKTHRLNRNIINSVQDYMGTKYFHHDLPSETDDLPSTVFIPDQDFSDLDFPDPQIPADENFSPDTSIWQLSIGAIDNSYLENNGVNIFFSENVSPLFKRSSRYFYYCVLDFENRGPGTQGLDFDDFSKYCCEEGKFQYATSLWFTDLVGHVSVPERIIFS